MVRIFGDEMREGKHIKIQVYGATREILNAVVSIEKLLLEMVHAAGMRELGKPHVYDIPETLREMDLEPDREEPEGVTGIVVLSTSHVAIHTWPHRGYAIIDLYSCRDFKEGDAVNVVVDALSPKKIMVYDLSYSLDLPDAPGP